MSQNLSYPEESAGEIMNVEYIEFPKDISVKEAISKIRQQGINKETIYTCYITEEGKLTGVVSVKDLLLSDDQCMIAEIMSCEVIYATIYEDREEVVARIDKYGLIAIPIVDEQMYMLGIVTVDDAMEIMREEVTEDMSVMAGIVLPNEESYFHTSVWEHTKSRFPWLLFLMLSATLSGLILGYFESAILSMPILNTFVTMLTGTGGNCGSQSSTLIIRGLAVGEIRLKDIFKIIYKEVRIALLVGIMLAVVNGVRILLMYGKAKLAFAIGITLVCTVVLAKIIGCALPLLAKKCGLDPALMAAPLITTLVDTGTILIYFMIVTKLYKL